MKHDKKFRIEWGTTHIVTIMPAENEEEAISKFKDGLKDECRDEPGLIHEVREV